MNVAIGGVGADCLGENLRHIGPKLVHGWHDDMARIFIVELLDSLAEIGFDDLDADRGHVVPKAAFLGQHRPALDQRLGAMILKDAVDYLMCSAASRAQCTWTPLARALDSNCSKYWSRWVSVCSLIAEASARNSSHSAIPCISQSRFCRRSHSRSSCIFSCSGAAMKRAAASAWSIDRLPWTLAPRGCGSGRERSGFEAASA